MVRKLFVFLFLLLILLNNKSQKLIPNGSFELYKQLPIRPNQGNRISEWIDINNSCEYYNDNSKKLYCHYINNIHPTSSISPFNIEAAIKLKPKTGNAYIGMMDSEKIKDLMFVELTSPLKKKQWYVLNFYLNHFSNRKFSYKKISNIFIFLKKENTSTDSIVVQVSYEENIKELRHEEWQKVSGTFQATGNEKYLYIATLKNDKKTPTYYYCIDDLDLHIVSSINEAFNTKNICFEISRAKLLEASFKVLDNIIKYINSNDANIEISGHTDNTGSDKKNFDLSMRRAEAVYDYFIEHGIDKSRLKYKGYGSSKPLMPNTTEKNRSKNRRVEIKIID